MKPTKVSDWLAVLGEERFGMFHEQFRAEFGVLAI